MAIRKRGNSYIVDVKVEGVRHRETATTYEMAAIREAELRASMLRGEKPTPGKPGARKSQVTLKDLYDRVYMESWKGSKSEKKITLNGIEVVSMLGPDTPAKAITRDHIQGLVERLAQKGNSNSTINRKLSALSKMLRAALRDREIPFLPHIPRFRQPKGRTRYLTEAEERQIFKTLAWLGREPEADGFRILLDTGMRMGEMMKLRVRDVTEYGGRLRVHLWDTKNSRDRTVPLTPKAADAVHRQMARIRPFSGQLDDNQRLFPFAARRMNTVWEKVKHQMGETDKQFVPHILRHTAASRMVQRGVPLSIVQGILGHTSVTTTERYSHLAPGSLEIGIEALEQATEEHAGVME